MKTLCKRNLRFARMKWGSAIGKFSAAALKAYSDEFQFSITAGDLLFLDGKWYATHAGLLRLARRRRCAGIHVKAMENFCDASIQRWAFRAVVFKSPTCRGFGGYGDADPTNVSPLVQGAEMRVAETRAVNRALRKAYGIGICSVEELESGATDAQPTRAAKKAPQPANGNGYGGRKLRDRLCQLIRQHQLDPTLVKAYATDFCGAKILRDATREQVEAFVQHLADWAEKDRNALLCQLNSYLRPTEGGAA